MSWNKDAYYDDEYKPEQNKYVLIGYLEEDDDYCMGCHMEHLPGYFFVEGHDTHGDNPEKIVARIANKLVGRRGKVWEFTIINDGRMYELKRGFSDGTTYFGIEEIDEILPDAMAKAKAEKEAQAKAWEEEKEAQIKADDLATAKWQLEMIKEEHPELLKGERK